MKYLFDYGEGLLCLIPFSLIWIVAAILLWNNLPSRAIKKKKDDSEPSDGD